jgi:hypothetical protein
MRLTHSSLLALALLAGCKNLDCGDNTLEKDGQCVANPMAPGFQCGAGTVYDEASGLCLNSLFEEGGGICGDGTVLVVDAEGIHYCEGTGTGSCDKALPCPTPTGENIALCGQLFDVEDSTLLSEKLDTTKIEVRVYDPIAFATDPGGTAPIKVASADACGRFAIGEITPPSSSFVAVAAQDKVDADDLVMLTGVATANNRGQARAGMRLFTMRRSTAAAWTEALALATPLEQSGGYLPIYLTPAAKGGVVTPPFPAQPTAGVKVTTGTFPTETEVTSNRYYFTDTVRTERKLPSAAPTATGMNGTALVLQIPGLPQYGGMDNEPAGCQWNDNLAATPPGTLYVQEKLPGPTEGCP